MRFFGLLACILMMAATSSWARVAPPLDDQPPFDGQTDSVPAYEHTLNPVEIIDGGDFDTLKALYPGVCEDDCPGLRRMRERRLQYEAQCVVSDTHEYVDFNYFQAFAGAQEALEVLEKTKQNARNCLGSLKSVQKIDYAQESVFPVPVTGRSGYYASLAAFALVPKDTVDVKALASEPVCEAAKLSLREKRKCP